jgi:hypothetical protein
MLRDGEGKNKTKRTENEAPDPAGRPDPPCLTAALAYARLGWLVLPLHNVMPDGRCSCGGEGCKPGKHPRTPHGVKDASKDPGKIRRWWRRWPDANVGIATGPESGLFVIGPDGAQGNAELAAVEKRLGVLECGPKARTPSGGHHLYCAWPPGGEIKNRVAHHGLAIDVRGKGGYVVAPPSVTDKGRYTWVKTVERTPGRASPEWERWARERPQPPKKTTTEDQRGCGRAEKRGRGLARKHPVSVQGQYGRGELWSLLCALMHSNLRLSPETALRIVVEEYNPRCQPPWPMDGPQGLRRAVEEAAGKGSSQVVFDDEARPTAPAEGPLPPPIPPNRGEEGWPDPIALQEEGKLPPFPVGVLPEWLANWVEAEAEAKQVPADLLALYALAFAGAGLAGRHRVEVRPGWEEPLNVYTCCCVPSGERKTATYAAALKPITDLERAIQAAEEPEIAERLSARRALTRQLDRVEKAKVVDHDKRRELARELQETPEPVRTRLYTEDCTPERMASMMMEQGGRLLAASDEGTLFEVCAGRYSKEANFDVCLKGHAASAPLRVDRGSRQPVIVDRPHLTIALAVQPDLLNLLASVPAMRRRGFLARFLWSMPVSRVGTRKARPEPVPELVAATYRLCMIELWKGPGLPEVIRFSSEADLAMAAFQEAVEPRLARDGDLGCSDGWGGKLPGAVARLCGILHACGVVGKTVKADSSVAVDVVGRAVRLAQEYLIPHALAALDLVGTDETHGLARDVWEFVRGKVQNGQNGQNGVRTFKRVDVCQASSLKRRLTPATRVDAALSVLVAHNLIRVKEEGKVGRGTPSPVYEVNPKAVGMD